MAGGLEQGSWGLGRVSKGLGGWGLERAEGLGSGGGGWTLRGRPDGRSFARSFARSLVRTDRKFTPLFYRTSSPSGPLPKRWQSVSGNALTVILSWVEWAGVSLSGGMDRLDIKQEGRWPESDRRAVEPNRWGAQII